MADNDGEPAVRGHLVAVNTTDRISTDGAKVASRYSCTTRSLPLVHTPDPAHPGASTPVIGRKRIILAAPTISDITRYAGGWLLDRILGGWAATLLTTTPDGDARVVRILGACAVDLETALHSPIPTYRPHTLAVDTQLCRHDPRVRRLVQTTLERGADVRLWGDTTRAGVDAQITHQRHRPSLAARAFKAQALQALGAVTDSGPADEIEMFAIASRCRPHRSASPHPVAPPHAGLPS